jgi:uncharacterized protein
VRAGYDVVALDAYGDLDQPSACHTLAPGERWRAATAVSHARKIQADAVVYLSNIDNDPRAVAALSAGRRLWGNTPEALRRARDPLATRDAFRAAGIHAPDVTVGGDAPLDGDWLVKPLRSGGGTRVRRWRGPEVPRGHYAQTFIDGTSGSVVFVAAEGQAVVFGNTRQLVGDAAFGASGFRYCGSLLCGPGDPSMRAQADAIARVAASAFGLVGVGGVDFVDDGRVMHPIEVNPRWTASMELVERARGLSVFGAHARACTSGALPAPNGGAEALVHGKAIVFARRGVIAGDTREWLADPTVRDIPRPGTRISSRQPVCTVLAHGADAAACYQALVNRAEAVYAQLAQWAPAAA